MRLSVTVERDDRTYAGSYWVTPGRVPVLHVESTYGSEATQVGGMPPEALARQLLRELIEKHLRRP
jgi:hypothetical protein